jgi:hypothetical protein
MVKITSRKELLEWLKDKPADWAQVIAARAALRVLPSAFAHDSNDSDKWMKASAIAFFRAVALPLIAFDFPDRDMSETIHLAGRSLAATGAHSHAYVAIDQATMTFTSHEAMIGAKFQNIISFTGSTIDCEIQSLGGESSRVWLIVSEDCSALESDDDSDTAVSRLRSHTFAEELGFDRVGEWASVSKRLYALDPTYEVWLNFYDRRILGEISAFDIPGDSNRVEDKKILAALADATNEDFWSKGATYVNTTLQGWIDEARERVKPKDYTQNPLAIGFGANPAGEVDVLPDMAGNRVLSDDDARDRHHIARSEARAAFAASSRDLTQAFEFDAILSDYLSALGEDVEAIRPSMLVLCGDKLRRLRAEYRSPASSKPPLAEAQAFALENWERAHNALVGIDPFLSAIERQSYGPDVPVIVIQLDAIKAVIDNAREAGVASAAAQDVLTDAVANVPAGATPDERRYRFSIESLKNFIRGTADLARKHGGKAAVGGYGASLWMQRNVEWLRDLFAGEQSILDIINWIATLPL